MDIKDYLTFWKKPDKIKSWSQQAKETLTESTPEAYHYYPIFTQHYDGEKTPGELGAPVHVIPDYEILGIRAREQYLKSDIAKIIVNAFVNWVIGRGLKLQSEPVESEIKKEGFNFDRDQFVKDAEVRYRLYTKTTDCDFSKNTNFIPIQRMAKKSAIIDGDVLVVIRSNNKTPNVQLISSWHIKTPIGGVWDTKVKKRGNEIKMGVEVSPSGEHIAFFVANKDFTFTRIPAKGRRTKRLQAFLVYGDEFRIDDVRGMPLYATNLEKIKKLDRYVEATVSSAEERAKIAYFFEHGINSTNENPMINAIKEASDFGEGNDIANQAGTITESSKKVAQTTGKSAINLPNDVTLKALESKNEINFGDFFNTNFVYICASVGIPYEVALSKFEKSFSASRMAAKQWEHLLKVERTLFGDGFLKPFYNIFLELQILNFKISADGYFTAIQKRDSILLEAYRNCRFIGANVPHVDPLKEVNAEVTKIKNNLTSYEAATEELGTGDFESNQEKLKKEIPERAFQDVIEGEEDDSDDDD